jgi:DNA replication protein DnaC
VPLYAAPATTEEVIRMISDESKRKLRELQLDSMVDALDDQDSNPDTFLGMSFDDRMNLLIDVCYTNKRADRAKRLLRYAKLRYPNADINTMYYDGRDLDRNTVLNLGTCSFINVRQNIIINGFTGSGKTHLACALGKEACRHLHRTRYLRMPEMLEMLNLAMETGHSITSVVTKLSNYHLLIIDEWLLDIPTEQEDKYLLEIFERRYDQWPTIFCSQYKTSEWHPRLGGGVVADAIMDRIVHNSTTINAGKLNMREFLAAHPL